MKPKIITDDPFVQYYDVILTDEQKEAAWWQMFGICEQPALHENNHEGADL